VNLTGLTAGTSPDTAETVLRQHLSPAIHGLHVDALIAALAESDDVNWTNAILAFNQLFKATASGKYLDQLATNDGTERPKNLGMADDLFRLLAIQLSTSKITHEALRKVLEIFYGADSLRAYVETAYEESFVLSSGLTLDWTLDEFQHFSVEFHPSQFALIGSAKAIEVAAVLTKAMRDEGSNGFAVALVDTETGGTRVRIYSGSIGLKSFVRVRGGTAQPYLRFDTYKEVYGGSVAGLGYSWVYLPPQSGHSRLSLTTPGLAVIDLSLVEEGDYLAIGPGVGGVTRGTYAVRNVSTAWAGGNLTQEVTLDVDLGFVGTITQASNDDYRFFTPTKKTTLNGSRTVVVAQSSPLTIDIQIPATTRVVGRNVHNAAYARETSAPRPSGDLGPYIYDVASGLAVTSIQTFLTSPLLKSNRYERIEVVSNVGFPDGPGYFVLGFGRSIQSKPIRYLARVGPNQLLIDFRYVMEFDFSVGSTVDYLSSLTPWVPSVPADATNFYLTGSASGRLGAQSAIQEMVCAGVDPDFTIVYPGARGLGGEWCETEGEGKISDIVGVFGGDEL
jgi:hypothetical protein